MTILFSMLINLSNSMACNEPLLICRTVCIQDGDETGIIINNKCYCANSRDVSQVVIKLNSNQKTNKQPVKAWYE